MLFTPLKASTQLRPSTGDLPQENPCSESWRMATRSHLTPSPCSKRGRGRRHPKWENTYNRGKKSPKIHKAPSKQNSQAKNGTIEAAGWRWHSRPGQNPLSHHHESNPAEKARVGQLMVLVCSDFGQTTCAHASWCLHQAVIQWGNKIWEN